MNVPISNFPINNNDNPSGRIRKKNDPIRRACWPNQSRLERIKFDRSRRTPWQVCVEKGARKNNMPRDQLYYMDH